MRRLLIALGSLVLLAVVVFPGLYAAGVLAGEDAPAPPTVPPTRGRAPTPQELGITGLPDPADLGVCFYVDNLGNITRDPTCKGLRITLVSD